LNPSISNFDLDIGKDLAVRVMAQSAWDAVLV
jgi:hypothetical protein